MGLVALEIRFALLIVYERGYIKILILQTHPITWNFAFVSCLPSHQKENLVTNLSPETFMAHVVLCPRLPHSLEISDIVLEYWRAVVEASLPLHPVPGEVSSALHF
jgi:hypothetical protein